MVQSVTNLAQQQVLFPLQRGENQQQQISQRVAQEQTSISSREGQPTQTRRSGTAPSQSQNSNAQYRQNYNNNEISVSDFRQQLGIEQNQRPPRGSLLDVSV